MYQGQESTYQTIQDNRSPDCRLNTTRSNMYQEQESTDGEDNRSPDCSIEVNEKKKQSNMDKWLQPKFRDLLENKEFSDCNIEVNKETFKCHKVVLASASEFFERMFLSDFKESKSGKFVLHDVQPETFAHFLRYVYTYDANALSKHTTSTIMELFVCGSTWLVNAIVFDCVEIIKKKLPTMLIGDLIGLFQKAHDVENKDLIMSCTNNLTTRYAETMNCCETLFLTSEVFKQYLIITAGRLPEIERFKMMQTYLSVNGIIDNEAVEPTEHVDGGVGQVEFPENSNNDDGQKEKERDDSESLGKTLTSKAAIDANGRKTDDVLLTEEKKDVKIKLIHQRYVKTLVDLINFSNMSKQEFYSVVGNSDLFSYKEKYEYLYLTK